MNISICRKEKEANKIVLFFRLTAIESLSEGDSMNYC